jgi:hypothetical protein
MLLISGKITSFQKSALEAAQRDAFTGRDLHLFGLISCLPEATRRDQANNALKREILHSEHLDGKEGDQVCSDVEIVKCIYSPNYGKHRITGRMCDSIVDFWADRSFEVNSTVRIRARIKRFNLDSTTSLNYVRLV